MLPPYNAEKYLCLRVDCDTHIAIGSQIHDVPPGPRIVPYAVSLHVTRSLFLVDEEEVGVVPLLVVVDEAEAGHVAPDVGDALGDGGLLTSWEEKFLI